MAAMKDRVRQILTDLERVRENLLELSDEIFRSKRSRSFVLQGCTYEEIVTWCCVYELVYPQVSAAELRHFAALPENLKSDAATGFPTMCWSSQSAHACY